MKEISGNWWSSCLFCGWKSFSLSNLEFYGIFEIFCEMNNDDDDDGEVKSNFYFLLDLIRFLSTSIPNLLNSIQFFSCALNLKLRTLSSSIQSISQWLVKGTQPFQISRGGPTNNDISSFLPNFNFWWLNLFIILLCNQPNIQVYNTQLSLLLLLLLLLKHQDDNQDFF